MPELPEVESVVRALSPALTGRSIKGVKVLNRSTISGSPARLTLAAGHRIMMVKRRGKYLLIDLSEDLTLAVHLRMTGWLGVKTRAELTRENDKFVRVAFELDGNTDCLIFRDIRKFGRIWCGEREKILALKALSKLGPEPLEISAEAFLERLKAKRGRLKSILLDQTFLAGLGNIYADEALFDAGLHPLAQAPRVAAASARRLHAAIQKVLNSKPYPFGQVEVLYIGTGPFATLTLPLTARFPSSVLAVHAVDVSQASLDCVARVVRHFEMEDSYPSRIRADATTVDWSKHLKRIPHIVVMECMASALLAEPQVAIVQNLVSQIGSNFILVPENIAIDVGTSTPNYAGEPQPFFTLDRTGVTMQRGHYDSQFQLVTGVFQRPDVGPQAPQEWTPHLETTVRTFGKHILVGKDSDITRTEKLRSLDGSVKEARITYELGGTMKGLQVQAKR